MKMILGIVLYAVFLFWGISSNAAVMQCGGAMITEGTLMATVAEKCDKPVYTAGFNAYYKQNGVTYILRSESGSQVDSLEVSFSN